MCKKSLVKLACMVLMITILSAVGLCSFSSMSKAASDPVPNLPNPSQWKYAFGDDFSGPNLSDLWEPYYFPYWSHSASTSRAAYAFDSSTGSIQQQVFSNSPLYDGFSDYQNPGFSGGMRDFVHQWGNGLVLKRHMPTNDKYVTTYGYFEIRAKLNGSANPPYSAAWWMTGFQDNACQTAEFDIVEYLKGDNTIGMGVHKWDDPNVFEDYSFPDVGFDPKADFHVYGFEWDPNYLKWYVDGVCVKTSNQKVPYRMMTWLSYNQHRGNVTGGTPSVWSIDYFRIWKNTSLPTPPPTPAPAPGDNLARYAYAGVYSLSTGIPQQLYKSYPPYNLNDGNTTTYYRTPDSNFPQYLYLDWTTPQTINTIALKCKYSKEQAPTNYDIEYSDDGRFGWKPAAQNIMPNWQYSDSTLESNTTYIETLQNVKHIRIRVNSANIVPGYFSVYEVEANYLAGVTPVPAPAAYQENYAPYAAVTATSEDTYKDFPVQDTVDEVIINDYHSANNPTFPQYVTLNWNSGKTLSEVVLSANKCLSSAPTNFDVEVSDDGSTNWTKVASSGDITWKKDDMTETKYLTFAAVNNKKGCRIRINSANLSKGYFTIAEIETNSLPTDTPRKRGVSSSSNLALSATAVSTGASAATPASYLNDCTTENGLVSIDNPAMPQYETFTWDTEQTFNTVTLKSWWCQGQAPTSWDIEVSTDGRTNWTKVASSGMVNWSTNSKTVESKTVMFPTVKNVKGVRIKVNSANLQWGHFAILELEVFNKNLALSATAVSTGASPATPAAFLNDGTTSNCFVSVDNPTMPQYETLTWANGQTFSNVNMLTWWCQGQAPTSWDIEVSEDGSTNWTRVASSGTINWATNNSSVEYRTVSFPTVSNMKGLRIKVNSANLQWSHFAIMELEVN